jgi:hypothetical protein
LQSIAIAEIGEISIVFKNLDKAFGLSLTRSFFRSFMTFGLLQLLSDFTDFRTSRLIYYIAAAFIPMYIIPDGEKKSIDYGRQ